MVSLAESAQKGRSSCSAGEPEAGFVKLWLNCGLCRHTSTMNRDRPLRLS